MLQKIFICPVSLQRGQGWKHCSDSLSCGIWPERSKAAEWLLTIGPLIGIFHFHWLRLTFMYLTISCFVLLFFLRWEKVLCRENKKWAKGRSSTFLHYYLCKALCMHGAFSRVKEVSIKVERASYMKSSLQTSFCIADIFYLGVG